MNAVILAGGAGTRLWPMSRAGRPKQFFDVVGEEPLIRDTYRRLLRLFPAENIYFSISPAFEALVRAQFPELPDSRLFIEPEKRDTGPAMGYVAALLEQVAPDEPLVFIPSDHYIGDEERFPRCLSVGERLVRETGKLVDIGVAPSFPSTALGYTKIGPRHATVEGIEVFTFAGHTEKPPYDVAKSYLEDGSYLWHANYYMWTPRKFMDAIATHAPEMARVLRGQAREQQYATLPKISFDYAVTEALAPKDVLIIRGDFGWSDIGAWDTVYDRLSGGAQNVIKGNCVTVDTTGSLIYGPADKLIAVVGMEGVVVVDTGDALLVCRREDAQRVKELVNRLGEEGHQSFV